MRTEGDRTATTRKQKQKSAAAAAVFYDDDLDDDDVVVKLMMDSDNCRAAEPKICAHGVQALVQRRFCTMRGEMRGSIGFMFIKLFQ